MPRDTLSQSDPSRPALFYGWFMLPVVTLVHIFTSPGQTYGISIFNPYLRQALDLSSSQLSGAYMLGTLLAALPLTWIGAMMDRHGARKTLTVVILCFGLTCLGMAQVSGLFSLFMAFFFLRMLGQSAMGFLAGNTLAMWFNRRLGTVGGIANFGMAGALGGIPPLTLFLIEAYGWRWTYVIFGLTVWTVLLPLMGLVYRNRPEDVGQVPDGGPGPPSKGATTQYEGERHFTLAQALRTRTYWIAATIMASWSMIGTGIQFHIVPLFVDRGLSAADAAGMFALYAAIIAGARLASGILADRVPLNLLIGAATTCQCLGTIVLIKADTAYLTYLFAPLFALGSGLLMAASETLWVRYYGRSHLGKIRGSITTISAGASGLGPFVMGVAYDFFGSFYQIIFAFTIYLAPLAVLGLLVAPPRQVAAETT